MKGKKLLSLLLALVMTVSMVGAIPAKAANVYSGSLSLEGNEYQTVANLSVHGNSKCMYLKGSDGLSSVPDSWEVGYTAADDNSGIYLDGEKVAGGAIKNYNANFWYMEGWGTGVTQKGQTITIKGNFANGDTIIALEETTFIWDGSRFGEPKETANKSLVDMAIGENGVGGANGFHFVTTEKGVTINDGMEADGTWSTLIYPKAVVDSGVLVNGTYYPVYIKKYGESTYYVDLASAGANSAIAAGSVVTVQGQFGLNGYVVDFNTHEFTYNGSTWACKKILKSGALQLAGNELPNQANTNASGIWGTGDEVLGSAYKNGTTGEQNWNETLIGKTSADGVFFNGTKVEGAHIKKYSDDNNFWYIGGFGTATTVGDTVTVKGDFVLQSNATEMINITESTFTWNGSEWSEDPVYPYNEVTLTSIWTSESKLNNEGTAWNIYANVDGTVPGTAWEIIFNDVTTYVGETEITTDVTVKKSTDTQLYFGIPVSDVLTAQPAEGTRVTFKAGSYTGTLCDANGVAQGDAGIGIKIISDYTMEWDGSKWGDPKVRIDYANITANSISGSWHDEFNRWNLVLGTDNAVPGEVMVQATFDTIEVTINGEEVSLPQGFFKFGENQLFAYIPESILGQEITEDTTIVIKGGKLKSEAQGVGIDIQKDITICINEYGWALEDFIEAPETVALTFTGLDAATGYSNKRNAWHFYLQPTVVAPGIADQSKFMNVKAVYNGAELNVHLDKAAHNDTVFLEILDTDIPKDLTENVTLTIKAGSYSDYLTGAIMAIEKDVVLYGNEYGWSLDGFIKPPAVTTVAFKGINQATGYSEKTQSWHLYLIPSAELPGAADSTAFRYFTVEANGTSEELEMWKAAHEGTAFIEVPTTLLPKSITKDMKLVFKAGTAVGSDQENSIKLAKDLVVYVNQYGFSLDGFLAAPTVHDKNVVLTLDRNTVYGGNQSGLYLDTTDGFPVDTKWATQIKASAYDATAGVYYNGTKVDAALKRYADGKVYLSLADAGITAKDKDKVTVKGVFALGEYGVSYKEVSFYFNGKIWNTTYEAAKPETYTKITGVSLNNVSKWTDNGNRWAIYINVEGNIPGKIDTTYFDYLQVEVNGKAIETRVSHSYQDTLFVPIYEADLPKDAADGTKITIKAGKALAPDMSTGIQWMKDFTLYTYKGTLSETEPTNDTKWIRTTLEGTNGAGYYNVDADAWYLFFETTKELATENGTLYAEFPLVIGGTTHYFVATQESGYLRIQIPTSIIPMNTMSNLKVELLAGTKIYANAGRNGVEIKDGWVGYVYNRAIVDKAVTEIEDSTINITGVQNVTSTTNTAGIKIHHVYLHTDSKFPGTDWYEHYTDFVYYYNGTPITSEIVKATSSTHKLIYFPIIDQKTGEIKEGDIVTIKAGTTVTSAGYKVTIGSDFKLIYRDGMWTELIATDAERPEKTASLWEDFRFKDGYIPTAADEDGSVWGTNESKFNTIYSTAKHKDYTMKFTMTKLYDDEVTSPMSIILRGTPVEEGGELDRTYLNGYVVTLSGSETTNSEGEDIWQQTIHIWKNGQNDSLVDQYRIYYQTIKEDHPFFNYEETYDYEISIYNVTETCVCIDVLVNDELVARCYDDAGSDAADPAINEGTFAICYGCPSHLTDEVDTELTEVISAVDECVVGEEVQFAVTYPFVLEGSDFSVDKDGATIKDGVFVATEVGTYTVSGSYNGKELTAKTIVVNEAPVEEVEAEGSFPIVPVVIAGVVLVLAIAGTVIFFVRKKRGKKDEK